ASVRSWATEGLTAGAHDLTEAAHALAADGLTENFPAAGVAPARGPAGDKQLTALLDLGRAGVARIPGKHGGPARADRAVQVVLSDRPGELARLFSAAAAVGAN